MGTLTKKQNDAIIDDIYSDITKMEKIDSQSKLVRYTLFLAYERTCFYCHEFITKFADFQIDHFIPENPKKTLQSIIDECGLPAFFERNSYYNFTPMHSSCNIKKRARLHDKTTIRMALHEIKQKIQRVEQVERNLIKDLDQVDVRQRLELAIEKNIISSEDLLKYKKPESYTNGFVETKLGSLISEKEEHTSSDSIANQRFRSYKSWCKEKSITYPSLYVADDKRENITFKIRKTLNENTGILIKICGYSGIGKSRFVFETLNKLEFRDLVLYCNIENQNPTEISMLLANVPPSKIIVFDDCSKQAFDDISRRWGEFPTNSAIIISQFWENIQDDQSTSIFLIDQLPRNLNATLISSILPYATPELINNIIDESFSIPKLLVFLLNQNDFLKNEIKKIDYPDEYVKKLVTGTTNPESIFWISVKKLLIYIALFLRIGMSGSTKEEDIKLSSEFGIPIDISQGEQNYLLSEEGHWLCNRISMHWEGFQELVGDLCKKGILDKDNYVWVRFSPIIRYLVNEWWRIYGEEAHLLLISLPRHIQLRFQICFFLNTEVYANLLDDKIYSNVVALLNSILSKESLPFITSFIFSKWDSLKEFDRKSLIRHLATTPDLQQLLCRDILIKQDNKIPSDERKRILSVLLNEEACLIQVSQTILALYQFKASNPIYDYILDEMLKMDLTGQCAKNFIAIIFKNSKDLPRAYVDRLKFYATKDDHTKTITSLLILNINQISPQLLADLFKILMYKPDSYGGLTYVLSSNIELFPSELYESFLLILLKFEEFSLFIARIVLTNLTKIRPEFLKEITQRISTFHTPIGLACRKLLSFLIPNISTEETSPQITQIIENMKTKLDEANLILLRGTDELENAFFKQIQTYYKPPNIKLLILTEFPGSQNDENPSFFYNPFSKENFLLFELIISTIFPDYQLGGPVQIKKHYLDEFKSLGYFLENVFPFAAKIITDYMEDIWLKDEFFKRIDALISKFTPIIIISEKLFKKISSILQNKGYFLAQNEPIVYPDANNIEVFKMQFLVALKKAKVEII